MDAERLYQEGVAKAEASFGEETREFDRAIWGMASVLHNRGRLPSFDPESRPWRDFVWRWHDPLASADFRQPHSFALWAKLFPLVADPKGEVSWPYAALPVKDGGLVPLYLEQAADIALAAMRDEAVIARKADELLDREIKRAYPKVRRGTKRYKELAESKRELAKGYVQESLRDEARGKVRAVLNRLDSQELSCAVAAAEKFETGLRERAADLLAINPGCSVGLALQSQADRVRETINCRLVDLSALKERLTLT